MHSWKLLDYSLLEAAGPQLLGHTRPSTVQCSMYTAPPKPKRIGTANGTTDHSACVATNELPVWLCVTVLAQVVRAWNT
jgi:hypothetical protein